jgi:hypothetical protein
LKNCSLLTENRKGEPPLEFSFFRFPEEKKITACGKHAVTLLQHGAHAPPPILCAAFLFDFEEHTQQAAQGFGAADYDDFHRGILLVI